MNLLTDPFFPVRRLDGSHAWLTWPQLATQDNPPVAFASARPDFDGALLQLAVGLLQTLAPPADYAAWCAWMRTPPNPDDLAARAAPYHHAFAQGAEGPAFMQDLMLRPGDGTKNGIAALLIDAPGGKTLKENKDFFLKRDTVRALCPACTALALFCLQTNAPSGGVGHRTGLRGGGPLTTVLRYDTLWRSLWGAVLDGRAAPALCESDADAARVFPWLTATRTSHKSEALTPASPGAHPLWVYWAMPRRIRLHPARPADHPCDLCGRHAEYVYEAYTTRNYGNNYVGWVHPLTPYYVTEKDGPLPVHGNPGYYGYRQWLGHVVEKSDTKGQTLPAAMLTATRIRPTPFLPEGREQLHVFGYDMENMKARAWIDRTMPYLPGTDAMEVLEAVIRGAVLCAEQVAVITTMACLRVLFPPDGKTRGDTGYLKTRFWQAGEQDFFHMLARHGRDEAGARTFWLSRLPQYAKAVFDAACDPGDAATEAFYLERRKLQHITHAPKTYSKTWPEPVPAT